MVGFGRNLPDGYLPVFSVDTEDEADELLRFACGTLPDGSYFARELILEQTLENLAAFSDRLALAAATLAKTKLGGGS